MDGFTAAGQTAFRLLAELEGGLGYVGIKCERETAALVGVVSCDAMEFGV
jgi:hypothetical protein